MSIQNLLNQNALQILDCTGSAIQTINLQNKRKVLLRAFQAQLLNAEKNESTKAKLQAVNAELAAMG